MNTTIGSRIYALALGRSGDMTVACLMRARGWVVDVSFREAVMFDAGLRGDWAIYAHLTEGGDLSGRWSFVKGAAREGHIPLLDQLLAVTPSRAATAFIFETACIHDQFAVVTWLDRHPVYGPLEQCSTETIDAILVHGNARLEIFNFIWDRFPATRSHMQRFDCILGCTSFKWNSIDAFFDVITWLYDRRDKNRYPVTFADIMCHCYEVLAATDQFFADRFLTWINDRRQGL